MAAPKGNQHAKDHGRPPKEGFSNEECISLGEELMKWMRDCDADKKCDVVHLSEWYSEIKGIAPSYWKESLAKRPCFSTYYERAMIWMGKRTMKNKKLSTVYGNRFLGVYYKELDDNEFEKEKKRVDYVHDKNTEIASKFDPQVLDKLNKFMNQLDGLQSQPSLRTEETSSIKE